jgi:phosphatidate cytidylyltransferase
VSSAQPHPPAAGDPAPGYRAIRWNMDWITRPLFGIALAAVAIWALFSSPAIFAGLVTAIAIPAAFEWHRMVAGKESCRVETAVSAVTVALALLALLTTRQAWPGLLLLAAGAVLLAVLAQSWHQNVLWQAFGVIYLGLPALALVFLRSFVPRGNLILVGLFLIVWATDSGALIFGNLVGGPRLAPRLSPAKTWAGTIGGSLTAALVFGCYTWLLGGSLWAAALFGLVFSVSAHAGDLFESFAKRHFGIKDSGTLIPGHGGVLDRMDSTFAASVVLALLVFFTGLNPLFGVAT